MRTPACLALVAIACIAVSNATASPTTAAASDLERTVTAMARIGRCTSPSFSADGTRIAFVSNLSGSPQIWTVAASGGWADGVTALDDPVGFVEWSPGGSQLAFTLAPGGRMNEQVYLVRPDGADLRGQRAHRRARRGARFGGGRLPPDIPRIGARWTGESACRAVQGKAKPST